MYKLSDCRTIDLFFESESHIPAPFSFEMLAKIQQQADESFLMDFSLHYTDRQSLTEDEIMDEGFSINDDQLWQGTLPQVWVHPLLAYTENHTTPSKNPAIAPIVLNEIALDITETQGFEYFIQELIQAVFELSERETPLQITFREVFDAQTREDINLFGIFAERHGKVQQSNGTTYKIGWEQLRLYMQEIMIGDFLEDQAGHKSPIKSGKYLSLGNGIWYQLGKSLKSPRGNNYYLRNITDIFLELNKG